MTLLYKQTTTAVFAGGKEVKEVALPCHMDCMRMAGKEEESVREVMLDGGVG